MSATAVLAALLTGVGSALLPLVNAEAYAVAAGAVAGRATGVGVALALGLGQTIGKLVLYAAARRGVAHRAVPLGRLAESRWAARVTAWLRSGRTATPLVLVSALSGLPPLAVVSVVAGAARMRWWLFAGACLVGRVARFAVLVLPLAWRG